MMDTAETLPMVLDAALTPAEADELVRHESAIERGARTFIEVGNALAAIRDKRLYRGPYQTFEDYCRARWGMGRRYANRIVEAAEVAERLGPHGPKPTMEAQIRPLTQLKPEQQREVWDKAVASVPADDVPTPKIVEKIAREVRGDVTAPATEPAREAPAPIKKLTARTQAHVAGTRYQTLIVNAAGMPADTLGNLPVGRLAEVSATIYLTAEAGDLAAAFMALDDWGFTIETVLTICTPDAKFGRYFHGSAGFVVVANRAKRDGRLPMKPGVIMADRDDRGHPDAFYRLVLSSTSGPYLEMFPRTFREHVSVWGEETPIDAAPQDEARGDDWDRLNTKERVRRVLSDGVWRTAAEIASIVGVDAAVVSARCRELTDPKDPDQRERKGKGQIQRFRLLAG